MLIEPACPTVRAVSPPAAEKREAGIAASAWRRAPAVALDADGPTNAFRRLGADAARTSIVEYIEQTAIRDPGGTAVMEGNVALRRRDLLASSDALVSILEERVPHRGRVAILVPHSAAYAVSILACLSANLLFAALDPRYPRQRNVGILLDFKPDAVLYSEASDIGMIGEISADFIDVSRVGPRVGEAARTTRQHDVDSAAVVLFTSGSTGAPKGVVLSQRAIMQRVAQQIDAAHVNDRDVLLCLSSPCTIAGLREMLAALVAGAVLLMADLERLGLRGTYDLLKQEKVSLLYVVPSLARQLFAAEGDGVLASLRVVRLGGERVTGRDIAKVRRATTPATFVQISYSSTETTGAQRFLPAGVTVGSDDSPSVGPVLPGAEYAIVNEAGASVPEGEDGELVLRGPHVCLGFWQAGESQVSGALFDAGGYNRVLRTGDVARDHSGIIQILGRRDREIKINGRRVEPAEIEAAIASVPGITQVVVQLAADLCIVAFLATAGARDQERFLSEVRLRLADRLPFAWHPQRTHVLEHLPYLPSGKIDTCGLAAIDAERAVPSWSELAPVPLNDDAALVRGAWMRVLGRRARRPGIAFVECGGDSMSFLRVIFEIEEALGRRVDLDRLDLEMTVEEMAAAVGTTSAAAPVGPVVVVLPGLAGDSPGLASLRAELGGSQTFDVVAYPDWRMMAQCGLQIEDIAESVSERLLATCASGFCILAYSFGGAVAYEVASRLLAAHREVERLVVLDAAVEPTEEKKVPWPVRLRAFVANKGGEPFAARLARVAALALTGERHIGALRRMANIPSQTMWARRLSFFLDREIQEALQRRAFRTWRRMPHPRLPVSCHLLATRSGEVCRKRDLGWEALCTKVEIDVVDGDHVTMLRQPNRAALRERLKTIFEPA